MCAQISRLEGDRLAHVVDIIQSALPPNSRSNSNESEDAELEIPVDELDTFTLRKLQDYVMGASASSVTMLQPKKKRGPPPGVSPRAPKEPAAKKAKTSGQVGRPSKQKLQGQQQSVESVNYTNISAPASTTAPTFFSDRTFDSAAAEGSGSDNDGNTHSCFIFVLIFLRGAARAPWTIGQFGFVCFRDGCGVSSGRCAG